MIQNSSQKLDKVLTVQLERLKPASVAPPKRRMIVFPTAVSDIPPDLGSMKFGENVKLPQGYIDPIDTKESRRKLDKLTATTTGKDSVLKDSVITPGFERNFSDATEKSYYKKLKERKLERNTTGGKDWYNIKSPELTEEVERDLNILQMRSILDPKRFYKHNDRQAIPKHFQVGKIMDNAADFYSSRVPKKQRKRNLAEELLEDAQFQQYQKRKYNELTLQKKQQLAKKRPGKHKKKSSKM